MRVRFRIRTIMIAIAAVAALMIPLRNMLSVDPSWLFAAVFWAIVVGLVSIMWFAPFIGLAFALRKLTDTLRSNRKTATYCNYHRDRSPKTTSARQYDGEPRCDRATTKSAVYESDRQ